jgi:hypothetical protein
LPTLVLFGPETVKLFGPIGDHIQTLSVDLACSPCVNALNHRFSPCNDNVCMQDISVERCLAALQRMLGTPAPAAPRSPVEVVVHVNGAPMPATTRAASH